MKFKRFQDQILKQGYENLNLQDRTLNLPDDSLKNELLFDYSYHYYLEEDSLKFRRFNDLTRRLSFKLKDTAKLAESDWDLANFFYKLNITDSSYYYYNRSFNYYEAIGDSFQSGRMLLNMAIIQKNIKDYIGSEVTTIQSIKRIKPLNKPKQLYMAYNNLGILFNALEDYPMAIEYHKEALKYHQNGLNNEVLKASTFNNIGVIYKNYGKYELAIQNYKKALEVDSIYEKRPQLYAMIIENIAYAKLKLGMMDGVEDEMKRALLIRDSLGESSGIVINKLHLAEYFLNNQDTLFSIKFAKEAKEISKRINANENFLKSLLFLSKIESNNSNKYLLNYISLSDSLQKEERQTRNKFARIRYETDQFIDENQQLNEERKYIFAGSLLIVLFLGLLYIIRVQRINNKRLVLERKQQEANEEIYHLMIASQQKIEEGKNKEKKRISEELHDGILSKFFGIRLNLEILNEKNDKDSFERRSDYIKELKQIELEIRNVSHELSADSFSDEVNFKRMLEDLIEDQRKLGEYKIDLKIDDRLNWEDIYAKSKVHLYRILQEALHNINKYASASKVAVHFKILGQRVILIIKDNGKGFDPEKAKDGIGLKNMKSRVEELNGDISIKSNKSGTSIKIEFQY